MTEPWSTRAESATVKALWPPTTCRGRQWALRASSASHYAFFFGLKAAGGPSPAASQICIHTVVWRGCCGSTQSWTEVCYQTTSVWRTEQWRLPSCRRRRRRCGRGAPDVNEVPLRSHVAAVSKRWFPVQGCIEVSAYSTWMCWSCVCLDQM